MASRRDAGRDIGRRTLGSPTLFVVIYTLLASAIYFTLGAVGSDAFTLTPLVYLAGGVLFALAGLTYLEGASLHQERSGATVFARYAFNELWSFIAGWALLLDYVILISVTTFSATNYLGAYWGELGHGASEIALEICLIAYVGGRNIVGFNESRTRKVLALVLVDVVLQLAIVVVGLLIFFDWHKIVDPIDLGTTPTWGGLVFALGLSTVVFTGLESASGLAGEVAVSRRGLKRLLASATAVVAVAYVGIAVVAVSALPLSGGAKTVPGPWLEAPMLSLAGAFDQHWDINVVRYVIAAAAAMTLIAGANSAMLGLSRLAYSLATHRQIPSSLGRLHSTRSTPFVVIVIASVLAAAIGVPADMNFLVGIFAFGALLGLTIAHVSVCVLRYREPTRDRPFRIPLSVHVRGGDLPIPAVLGALLSAGVWVGVLITHEGARYVGLGWMAAGLALYVGYRRSQGSSLTQRLIVPEQALRERELEAEYGSILVPLFGTPLDDDIVQTAGRLAAAERGDEAAGEGAMIEALWIFEVPMALPIDARLPEAQLDRARAALRRAKAVGEEYEGVEVATATVRARRVGHAIVEEARRRGVEVIVLAAEEPSRIRGGSSLGGRGQLDNFVGEVTKHVINKATCRVILTAPPARKAADRGSEDLVPSE